MTIAVSCRCGKQLRLKEDLAGKVVVCPSCKNGIKVPDPSREAESAQNADAPGAGARSLGARKLIVAGGILAVVLAAILGAGIGVFGWFRGGTKRDTPAGRSDVAAQQPASPTIVANPNPVPPGGSQLGTTTISWDTGDKTVGDVYVSANGGEEKRFAGNRPRGSQEAKFIGRSQYVFRLYAANDHSKVLASVTVTRGK